MKFLLVEDDPTLAIAIKQLLTQHHYVTDLATDGLQGKAMAEAFAYDLILLDWTLPKLDGVQLCKYLRNTGDRTPIILLTARQHSVDKVAGLDAGADDYLAKPFGFEELLARIRALLRRSEGIVSPVLQWGDLCLDPGSSRVSCRQMPITVTPKEYALLELFLRNPNRIFSLDSLLDKVWPFEDSPNVGSVRTHIKGLRQKLKKAGLPDIIATVYGLGYRLEAEDVGQLKSISQNELKSELKSEAESSPESSLERRPESSPESPLDLSSLWQSVSQNYRQRVATVVAALGELSPGPLDAATQQQISTEAHSLAGSLGSFGFQSVTVQCREVESILRNHANLSAQHIQQLKASMAQVQQTIAQGLLPRSPTSTTDVASGLMPIAKTPDAIAPTDEVAAAKLLIVDDDLAMLAVLQSLLQPWGFQVQLLSDARQFWQVLEEFSPDLVLLDVKMPNISGLDLCQSIREAPRWHDLPIVFMSGYSDVDTIQEVFSAGADDYIRKPIVAPELVARVLSWLERARTRRLRADVDSLTGIANRQKSAQQLIQMLDQAQQQAQTLCFALVDFNQFKQINMEYGHALGDRILKHFGDFLRLTFSDQAVVGRWGGEEFVIGLYGLSVAQGAQRLHGFLHSWQQASLSLIADLTCEVSLTAGIVAYPDDATDLQGLYRAADRALLEAKAKANKASKPRSLS